MVVDVDIYSH